MKTFIKIIYYSFLGLITIVAILLIVSVLPITGDIKFLVVESGSMEPSIKMGSVVVVKPEQDYKKGDVITFYSPPGAKVPTTHRVYGTEMVSGQIEYITKGDANDTPDRESVKKKYILGKVLIAIPYLGYGVAFVKKPIGFLLVILVPTFIIIFGEIKNIYAEIKKKQNNG